MDRQSLTQNLRDSRLFDDEQIASLDRQFAGKTPPEILPALVSDGTLTAFQAKRIESGQTKGLVLGRYCILEELGQGGYGHVYKARHQLMNRIVALKVIAPERVADDRARDWFRREVLAATQLSHPNIATAYDADDVEGTLFFAMEYIDGPTLDALVRQQGALPIGLACEMLHQAAKALQYAHEKGMVHRDIKPANFLIPRQAIAEALANPNRHPQPALVKVVDFGLARVSSVSTEHTLVLQNEKSFVGTPDYVAPEQARNVHSVDIRSDLYSLGCTFYFALTGQKPFRADNLMEIIVQHLEKEPEPIESLRPEVPAALASIIRRLMAKKPDKRFQAPTDLLAELSFFYGVGNAAAHPSSGLIARPPASLFPQPAPAPFQPVWLNANKPASTVSHTNPVEHWPEATRELPAVGLDAPAGAAGETPATIVTVLPLEIAAAAEAIGPPPSIATAAAAAGPRSMPVFDASLAQAWQRWTEVIERLCEKGQCSLSEVAYRQLYDELLECCRTHAARADAADQPFFQQLEEMVTPWLTVRSLASIDRDTLASLLQRCQLIEQQLGIRKNGNVVSWVALLACVICAGSLGWFVLQTRGSFSLDMSFARSLWASMEAHPVLSLAVVFPALVAASLTLFGRVLRS